MFRIMFCLLIAISMWSCTTTINNVTSPKTVVDTTGTMTDIDGNVYATVKIGSQTWMTENLKTTKFNDGTAISYITDMSNWDPYIGSGGDVAYNTIPEYCYYNFLYSNRYTYGALYNSSAVRTGKLGPAGWHIPSLDEWQTAYRIDSLALKTVLHKGGDLEPKTFGGIDICNVCWCSDTYTNAYGEVFPWRITCDGLESNFSEEQGEALERDGCSVRLVKD